jgi:hypothetical protein
LESAATIPPPLFTIIDGAQYIFVCSEREELAMIFSFAQECHLDAMRKISCYFSNAA